MTLSDLSSIVGVISGLAVLGSLVYLAQQTRQNSKHTRALIHQGRVGQGLTWIGLLVSDPSLTDTTMRGMGGDETLDDVQVARFHLAQLARLLSVEDLFFQHREGLVDDTRHKGMVQQLRQDFANTGFRASWKLASSNFDPEFQTFMDGLIKEVHATPVPRLATTWRSLAAADSLQASGA